jgi:hypothetical protein
MMFEQRQGSRQEIRGSAVERSAVSPLQIPRCAPNKFPFRYVCCWRKWRVENYYPALRKEREGWGTRTSAVARKRKDRPLIGLRPSFSAHVRWCEHGAPV